MDWTSERTEGELKTIAYKIYSRTFIVNGKTAIYVIAGEASGSREMHVYVCL